MERHSNTYIKGRQGNDCNTVYTKGQTIRSNSFNNM